MQKAKVFTLLSVIIFPIVLIVMGTTFRIANDAARRTPAASNFRQFAEPASKKPETKIVYLYSPFLLQCLGIGAWGYWFIKRREVCEQGRNYLLPVVWLVWTFALGVGGRVQATHALTAAGQPIHAPSSNANSSSGLSQPESRAPGT